jgi:hypothetical protein
MSISPTQMIVFLMLSQQNNGMQKGTQAELLGLVDARE